MMLCRGRYILCCFSYSSFPLRASPFTFLFSSLTVRSGSSFPNVTLPDMELMGAQTRIHGDAVIIYYCPIVTDESRPGWEHYATDNRNWLMESFINEQDLKAAQDAKFGIQENTEEDGDTTVKEDGSRMLQEEETGNLSQVVLEDGYNTVLFGVDAPRPIGSGPFVPLWQVTPVVPIQTFLNFDLLVLPAVRAALLATIESHQAVLSRSSDIRDPDEAGDGSGGLYDDFLAAGQFRHDTQTYLGDPSASLIVPVFNNFSSNRTLEGIIMAAQYWRMNFINILPETAKGVICVLENTQNQTFSYRIDGKDVTFLGPGDRHDPKYDHMVVSEEVNQKLQTRAGPENQGFDATLLNEDHCQYTVRVYPSKDTEDEYVNSEPVLYTLLVAAVFLVTSLIFIGYDLIMAKRRKFLLTKAVKSAAIVSSLYPHQVRDRLFRDDDANKNAKSGNAWMLEHDKADTSQQDSEKSLDRPIADSFEACTVLFADLSGFTKWSTSRQPEDVFFLLESIYQAFDGIASRRNVFKVETIGDCVRQYSY